MSGAGATASFVVSGGATGDDLMATQTQSQPPVCDNADAEDGAVGDVLGLGANLVVRISIDI